MSSKMMEPAMRVEVGDKDLTVDCETLAPMLGVQPSDIPGLLRIKAITSLCEKGIDEHEGEFRLTFFFKGRRARILVGPSGTVLGRSVIDFGDRPLPPALRRDRT